MLHRDRMVSGYLRFELASDRHRVGAFGVVWCRSFLVGGQEQGRQAMCGQAP
jgi:hypothetical protein